MSPLTKNNVDTDLWASKSDQYILDPEWQLEMKTSHAQQEMDEHEATVTVTFNFRPHI